MLVTWKKKNNYEITIDGKKISLIISGNIPFGIEDYNEKKIINIEINKKIADIIFDIEKKIKILFPYNLLYSSIKKRKNDKFLLRAYIKQQNGKIYTKVYNFEKIKEKTYDFTFDIYIDRLWKNNNKIGILWFINFIKKN